ncbi:MAG: hypothetical protein ACTHJ2_06940 [Candidatus Nitrosocosmicus sp.]
MVTLNKKQTSLALVAVVFATAMIVGTIASADNMAFATSKKVKQKIGESNSASQTTSCSANGGSGLGTGSALLLGAGIGAGGLGGLNLCFNTNPQTNINQGSTAAQP